MDPSKVLPRTQPYGFTTAAAFLPFALSRHSVVPPGLTLLRGRCTSHRRYHRRWLTPVAVAGGGFRTKTLSGLLLPAPPGWRRPFQNRDLGGGVSSVPMSLALSTASEPALAPAHPPIHSLRRVSVGPCTPYRAGRPVRLTVRLHRVSWPTGFPATRWRKSRMGLLLCLAPPDPRRSRESPRAVHLLPAFGEKFSEGRLAISLLHRTLRPVAAAGHPLAFASAYQAESRGVPSPEGGVSVLQGPSEPPVKEA